jgi:hypothetical protein
MITHLFVGTLCLEHTHLFRLVVMQARWFGAIGQYWCAVCTILTLMFAIIPECVAASMTLSCRVPCLPAPGDCIRAVRGAGDVLALTLQAVQYTISGSSTGTKRWHGMAQGVLHSRHPGMLQFC